MQVYLAAGERRKSAYRGGRGLGGSNRLGHSDGPPTMVRRCSGDDAFGHFWESLPRPKLSAALPAPLLGDVHSWASLPEPRRGYIGSCFIS